MYQALLNGLLDLFHFDLAETFDLQKCLARGTVDGLEPASEWQGCN